MCGAAQESAGGDVQGRVEGVIRNPQNTLTLLRQSLVNGILWATVVLGGIAAGVGIIGELRAERYTAAFFYGAIYGSVFIPVLWRSLRYEIRALVLPLLLFLMAVSELFFFTIVSDAVLYFFACVVFMGMLHGLRGGVAALVLSVATVAVAAWLHLAGVLPARPLPENLLLSRPELAEEPFAWLTAALLLLFIGGAALVSLTLLLRSLSESVNSAQGLVAGLHNEIAERRRAEEAMRWSEESYRALNESSPDTVATSDLSGTILSINRRGVELQGYASEEEVLGKTFFEMVDPKDHERVAARMMETVETGRAEPFELTVLRKDGTTYPGEASGCLILDGDNQPRALMAIVRDISERKRAEEEKREREFFLIETQKIARIGGWRLNPETDFLAWTEGIYDIVEAPPDYRPGLEEGLKYYLPEYIPILRERIQQCFVHGDPFTEECELLTDSGKRLWAEVRGLARVVEGKTVYVYGVLQDITERKQAEAERAHLLTIMESTSDLVATAGPDTRIMFINQAGRRLLGWGPGVDPSARRIREAHPRWAFEILNTTGMPAAIRDGIWEGETAILGPDGAEIPVSQVIMAHKAIDGRLEFLSTIMRDITERKRAERERAEQLWLLENLERVDDVIRTGRELEFVLEGVLHTVLDVLECDRVYLLYPCNPDAATWSAPMECTHPDFPGAFSADVDVPMTAELAESFRQALESDDLLHFGLDNGHPLPDAARRFGIRSAINVALRPKAGEPWLFGVCQCSYARAWTPKEERLIVEVTRRLEDSLSSFLFLQSLQESEAKFRTIFDSTTDAMFLHNAATGAILSANRAALSMMERTLEEILQLDIGGLSSGAPPYTQEEAAQRVGKALEEGPQVFEWRAKRRDGTLLWVEVALKRVEIGGETRVLAIVRDIDERKRTDEELRHLRNYLSNIIDSMPSVLVGVDPEGTVTQWNSEAQKSTGIAAAEATGQPLAHVFPRLASEMDRVREAMRRRQTLSAPKQPHQEDGETRYEDVTVYPLTANGVEGAVIRVDDITDRVRIEEMMVQSEKMLSVGGLAAGMAHEINNPLGGMMQTASVMRDRLTDLELPANRCAAEAAGISMEAISAFMEARNVPKMLDRIRESGSRAAEIVQNMLSFARKDDATISTHAIGDLLDQCVELAGSDYDLKKKYDFRRIEIVREYEDGLPEVPCESGKVQQVLLNILRNGAEAMQEAAERGAGGKPCFILRLAYERAAGMIRIEIEDNGPGMNEGTRKRVFEPFFTTKATDRGTGLGLSVSYFIIVENHGGKMSVESTPGAGTTFAVSLPVERKRP